MKENRELLTFLVLFFLLLFPPFFLEFDGGKRRFRAIKARKASDETYKHIVKNIILQTQPFRSIKGFNIKNRILLLEVYIHTIINRKIVSFLYDIWSILCNVTKNFFNIKRRKFGQKVVLMRINTAKVLFYLKNK